MLHWFTCKICFKQDVGSIEDFLPRLSNYRCANRNFLKGKKVKQELFNARFAETNYNGDDDGEKRLIYWADNVGKFKRR